MALSTVAWLTAFVLSTQIAPPPSPPEGYALQTPTATSPTATPQDAPAFQPVGDSEIAPLGFLDLCSRSPVDCAHWPESDLSAIAKRAIDIKLVLYRKAFDAPPPSGAHPSPVVLTVGTPPYLSHDWLPHPPVDQSVYTWPMSPEAARLKDQLEMAADQFPFGPVDAIFIPAGQRRLQLVSLEPGDLDGNLNWPALTGLDRPGVRLSLSDLLDDGPQALHLAGGLTYSPSADTVAQEVFFRLSAQADPIMDSPKRQVVAERAPADETAGSPASPVYPQVKLTPTQYTILRRVNAFVNRAIAYETDVDQYHIDDYWVAPGVQPGARGDCEDYALEKRRQLINLGFPAAAMSLAIISMPEEKTHAVLIVTTTDADYVLDNLSSSIKVWHDTHYPWILRQGPQDDLSWFSLYPVRLVN